MTFLQPDEVFHFKLDSNDTYGISKYAKSLFSAKIYLATLITNLMQKVSRGRDKRAFYVDTGMDDDIEGVVQSFIRDIKSREITTNTMNNITTLLNSVGAFEDYFIPTIDGEKPIEIDTVQGMDIDVDNEFLNNLLKSCISGTGIPGNYIDATMDVDFARTLAMQNQAFVRTLVCYQNDFSNYYTNIIRKLYHNEFIKDKKAKINNKNNKKKNNIDLNNEIDINKLFIKFPPPIYLSLSNINEQISNATNTIDFLTNLYFDESSTEEDVSSIKLLFKQNLAKEYFLPSMEWDLFDKIFENINSKNTENILKDKIKNQKDTPDTEDTSDTDSSNDEEDY